MSVRKTCSCSIVRYTNRIRVSSQLKPSGLVRASDHKFLCNRAYNLVNLILKKIWKIGATRCQILRLKCTKIDFGWGSAQDPLRELTALSQAPYLYLRGLPRLLLRGRRGTGREEGKGKQGKGKGRGGEEEGKGREGGERPYTPPVANSWIRH